MTKPTDTLFQATAMIVAAQITARATRSASMPVMHAKTTLSHEFVDVYRALEHAIGQLSARVAPAHRWAPARRAAPQFCPVVARRRSASPGWPRPDDGDPVS